MELITLTPEGKILLTLFHGQHTYGELKRETGLSDRWLAFKLSKLIEQGDVFKNGKWYRANEKTKPSSYELSLYMKKQARCLAEKLHRLPVVKFVALFGSVAQGKAQEYSDIDALIVTSGQTEDANKTIQAEIGQFQKTFHILVESLVMTEEQFLVNVSSEEGGIIFGVAEGFEVLLDKTPKLGFTLRNRIQNIQDTHDYLVEERIWLKRNLTS